MPNNENIGKLIIIGGAEDKQTDKKILKKVISQCAAPHPQIAVVTTATNSPHEAANQYRDILTALGASAIHAIHLSNRADANDPDNLQALEASDCIFFVGGDQLRISSILGGTKAHQAVLKSYQSGKVIAGTSAGASMMSEIMVVEGKDDEAPRKCTMKMAPGMGLLDGVIIDQHFNQRGRIGRLLGAVAQNPNIIGIGIDEDTAILVDKNQHFIVEGSGVVTIVDGKTINFTNISEQYPNEPLAITNVTLHILPSGYGFDLINRKELIEKEDTRL